MLQAEGRVQRLGEGEGALVFPAAVLALGVEGQGLDRVVRVEVAAVRVGVGVADAVAEPAVQQVEVQSGVGDQLLGLAVFAAVAVEGVEIVAAAGPDRAQVQGHRVRHLDVQAAGQAGVGVAVILGPLGEGREAVGVVAAGRQTPAQALVSAADPAAEIGRAARAGLGVEAALQGFGRFGRDDIDHAADGLAAPQGRLGAAQHLDTRRVADQQVAEVETALGRGRVVQLDPVDQNDGVLALGAANVDARRGADAAVASEADTRRLGQKLDHGRGLARLDGGLGQDSDRGADALDRLGRAVGGDDHVLDGGGSGATRHVRSGGLLIDGFSGEGGSGGQKAGGGQGSECGPVHSGSPYDDAAPDRPSPG